MQVFPFMLLLWILSFSNPNSPTNLATPTNTPAIQATVIQGDSSIFHQLSGDLRQYLEKTRPEKLYLHLDRTLFRPGETLWFKAYLRNAGDLQPSQTSNILYVELISPQGSVLQQKSIIAENGCAPGEFDFPESLPGGLYKIKAYTNWMRNTSASFERTITLQKVVPPRLSLKFQFERKAFGPGDEVIARLDAFSLDNKPLVKRRLDISARVADQPCFTGTAVTDAAGRAYIRFLLPAKLASSDGLLNIQLEHEGQAEAISRAIPIVLNNIDLQFFPEGGELVAGLPCRVAFKALNEFGKPADVEGEVLDAQGKVVASFSSFHDGMGAFDLRPAASGKYTARLSKPAVAEYPLPQAQAQGYRLHVKNQDASGLSLELSAAKPGTVYLTATLRDEIFFFKEIALGTGSHVEKIPVNGLATGIVQLTVFDSERREQAERLAFINRDKNLKIEIKPDREQYLPRDKVQLDIRVRDHLGKPVKGNFSLAVADHKLLSYADDKQGRLLAALLLEQDVKGAIEEPNFYFDPAEPKAEQALDYLLMTQGWRHFSWKAVREKAFAVFQNFPERAIVAGTLLKSNGKPWKWAPIRLYPNGPEEMTDSSGYFVFENPDLSRYTHLEYNREYYPISGYRDNILLWRGNKHKTDGIYIHATRPALGSTILCGKITDDQGESLIGATVKVMRGAEFVRGTITDYNGDYRVALDPGNYDVEIMYTGYQTQRMTGIPIIVNALNPVDFILFSGLTLQEVTVSAFKVPLIQQDMTQGGQTLTSSQVRNLPTRSVNAIVATTAGTTSIDGGAVNIKGARSNTTNNYIDGIRVSGTPPPVQEDDMILSEVVFISKDAKKKERRMDRRLAEAPQINWRQYARARDFYVPKYVSKQQNVERTDFRSTIYWNPKIETDAKGRATVEFYTSDAITSFSAMVEGISNQGIAGYAEQKFFVQKPLSIALKTPASVITGDVLRLQIALSNKTADALSGKLAVQAPEHFQLNQALPETVNLQPKETKLLAVEFNIGQAQTPAQALKFSFLTENSALEDVIETEIRTLERGFPVRRVISGNSIQNLFDVQLHSPVEGSVKVKLNAYPNPMGDLQKGMERMLRQPSGCFEQVSSSNYPNLLVLDLLRQSGQIDPELERRALDMLDNGYKQLTAYECKDGGFDWWGRSPGHEGLTAYGILQFQDMAKVFPVDAKLTERSVQWLFSRRDGNGGWKRRDDWHGWQSEGLLGAYIAWAVSEAGFGKQFSAEIEQAYQTASSSGDPYQLALLANALTANKDKRGPALVQQLLAQQSGNGSWMGKSHSIMGGGGECLRIETTALTALALMKTGSNSSALAKAMDYISKAKNEYGYGSTQSTVLALKALVAYAKRSAELPASGVLVVQIDGKRVAEQAFSPKRLKSITLEGLEQYLQSDRQQVEVFFEKTKQPIPFDLDIEYASRLPLDARNCPFTFQTKLSQTEIAIGSTVRLSATLQNNSEGRLASPMIVLGIPAGLSLQPWQLKQLVEEKKCDFYELWDGFAVFHFEALPAGETRQINLDLRADIAGVFEAPAAQAFLYYENNQRLWSKPERVTVRE